MPGSCQLVSYHTAPVFDCAVMTLTLIPNAFLPGICSRAWLPVKTQQTWNKGSFCTSKGAPEIVYSVPPMCHTLDIYTTVKSDDSILQEAWTCAQCTDLPSIHMICNSSHTSATVKARQWLRSWASSRDQVLCVKEPDLAPLQPARARRQHAGLP